jgi:hypothetical protein
VSATDLAVMRRLDRLHLEFPFAGSRMLQGLLSADGCKIGRRIHWSKSFKRQIPVTDRLIELALNLFGRR